MGWLHLRSANRIVNGHTVVRRWSIFQWQRRHSQLQTVVVPSSVASSQDFTIPEIPELLLPNFLDILLPPSPPPFKNAPIPDNIPKNPMVDALIDSTTKTLTLNDAPTYNTTGSPTLDAFQRINHSTGAELNRLLGAAWREDRELTLRIIWNLRSVPDGKGVKEAFYKAFGWLYREHPRTAISNLHLLVEPVCIKGRTRKAHGYWKDLLNILALETTDELADVTGRPRFLYHPRPKVAYPPVPKAPKPAELKDFRIQAAKEANERAHARALEDRVRLAAEEHVVLVRKLQSPKYRALYIAVARLFAERISKDLQLLAEAENLPPESNRVSFLRQLSLVGKWAPTPSLSHDRVTNISTAIASLLRGSQAFPSPASLNNSSLSERERTAILRSVYQRWVLTRLRKVLALPEPLMSSNRWKEILYHRVPSRCMIANKERFFMHDEDGFEKYLIRVQEGKSKISGATLMPHELIAEAAQLSVTKDDRTASKMPAFREAQKRLAEMQGRVIEGQWKSLVDNLRQAGTIDNAIAICDVSGSMGSLEVKMCKDFLSPIFPAVALSLILAQLAKPPFNNAFITFSRTPQYVVLDPNLSLSDTIDIVGKADWTMNTNLHSVFMDLLLPIAVQNKVKQEDMIKRLFIFSDMQFDSAAPPTQDSNHWETNHDAIEREYKKHGYEVPEIVYWDLAAYGTTPVTKETKGVALMNGFSPAMLKVFMGEEEAEEVREEVKEEKKPKTVAQKSSFDPVSVMKKALSRKSYEGLVVVD
ncbi:hypothetical protein ONZ45_g16092 [Pleurotus djamor]|nr:hypothetical protein ONZ45_g16092 [Pleurotus djamor]